MSRHHVSRDRDAGTDHHFAARFLDTYGLSTTRLACLLVAHRDDHPVWMLDDLGEDRESGIDGK